MNKNYINKGTSPIIGVILIVALTVSLVTLVLFLVFDINNINESADASVQLSETNDGIKAIIVRNENVDKFRVSGPNKDTYINETGDLVDVNQGGGTYIISAILENGSEEVLKKESIYHSKTTITGNVTVNPSVENAKIKVIENDNVVKTTLTNTSGEYNITLDNTENKKIVADTRGVDIEVNGENKNLYAKASRHIGDKERINFVFSIDNIVNDKIISESVSEGELSDKYLKEEYIEISNLEELQAINENLDANYIIVNDSVNDNMYIDGSNAGELNDGEGFEPIGDENNKFNGSLDGQGYVINDLNVENKNASVFNYVGEEGDIKNVGLINNNMDGDNVGGLVRINYGSLNETYTSGHIEDAISAGGLVNFNAGNINNSYTIGDVSIQSYSPYSGGVVGRNKGKLNNSYALGDVKGNQLSGDVTGSGGIVGINDNNGEIKKSYATGEVDAINKGGITGWNNNGEVKDSYWDINRTENGIGEGSGKNIVGLEQEEMIDINAENNMSDLDFINTWINVENNYPALRWQK